MGHRERPRTPPGREAGAWDAKNVPGMPRRGRGGGAGRAVSLAHAGAPRAGGVWTGCAAWGTVLRTFSGTLSWRGPPGSSAASHKGRRLVFSTSQGRFLPPTSQWGLSWYPRAAKGAGTPVSRVLGKRGAGSAAPASGVGRAQLGPERGLCQTGRCRAPDGRCKWL